MKKIMGFLLTCLMFAIFASVNLLAEDTKSGFNVIESFKSFALNSAGIDIEKGLQALNNYLNGYAENERKLIFDAPEKIDLRKLKGYILEGELEAKSGGGKINFIFNDDNVIAFLPGAKMVNKRPVLDSSKKTICYLNYEDNTIEGSGLLSCGQIIKWNISLYGKGNTDIDRLDENSPLVIVLNYIFKKDPVAFAFVKVKPKKISYLFSHYISDFNKQNTEYLLKKLNMTREELEIGYTGKDGIEIKGKFDDSQECLKEFTFLNEDYVFVSPGGEGIIFVKGKNDSQKIKYLPVYFEVEKDPYGNIELTLYDNEYSSTHIELESNRDWRTLLSKKENLISVTDEFLSEYSLEERNLISKATKKINLANLYGYMLEAELEAKSGGGKIRFVFIDDNNVSAGLPGIKMADGKLVLNFETGGYQTHLHCKYIHKNVSNVSIDMKGGKILQSGRNIKWDISIYETTNTNAGDFYPLVVKLGYNFSGHQVAFAFVKAKPVKLSSIRKVSNLDKQDTDTLLRKLNMSRKELATGYISDDYDFEIKGKFNDSQECLKELTFLNDHCKLFFMDGELALLSGGYLYDNIRVEKINGNFFFGLIKVLLNNDFSFAFKRGKLIGEFNHTDF